MTGVQGDGNRYVIAVGHTRDKYKQLLLSIAPEVEQAGAVVVRVWNGEGDFPDAEKMENTSWDIGMYIRGAEMVPAGGMCVCLNDSCVKFGAGWLEAAYETLALGYDIHSYQCRTDRVDCCTFEKYYGGEIYFVRTHAFGARKETVAAMADGVPARETFKTGMHWAYRVEKVWSLGKRIRMGGMRTVIEDDNSLRRGRTMRCANMKRRIGRLALTPDAIKGVFAGRSVAIVGNALSLLENGDYGKEIDSHDIVIRMNLGFPGNPEKQGKRTTIHATAGVGWELYEKNVWAPIITLMPQIWNPNAKLLSEARRRMIQPWMPDVSAITGAYPGRAPSMGYTVVKLIASLEAAGGIHLYGFDFKQTRTFYNPEEKAAAIKDDNRGWHSFIYEKAELERMHMNHEITIHGGGEEPRRLEPVDVVIALGKGSKRNDDELRYAMRSMQKNLLGLNTIWIVGHKPAWVTGVRHIECADLKCPKDRNIIRKIKMACEDAELTDRFVFWSDDQLLLTPATWESLPVSVLRDYKDDDDWYATRKNKWHTLLRETLGLFGNGARYYEPHTPMPMEKSVFLDMCRMHDWGKGPCIISTLYYNHSQRKPPHERGGHIFGPVGRREKLDRLLDHKQVVGYSDNQAGDVLAWAYHHLGEPSAYEIREPEHKDGNGGDVTDLRKMPKQERENRVIARYFEAIDAVAEDASEQVRDLVRAKAALLNDAGDLPWEMTPDLRNTFKRQIAIPWDIYKLGVEGAMEAERRRSGDAPNGGCRGCGGSKNPGRIGGAGGISAAFEVIAPGDRGAAGERRGFIGERRGPPAALQDGAAFVGLSERDCLACALKHVEDAWIHLSEYRKNPELYHRELRLARGELGVAENHAVAEAPAVAAGLRRARLAVSPGGIMDAAAAMMICDKLSAYLDGRLADG